MEEVPKYGFKCPYCGSTEGVRVVPRRVVDVLTNEFDEEGYYYDHDVIGQDTLHEDIYCAECEGGLDREIIKENLIKIKD